MPSNNPAPVHLCGEEVPSAGHICAFFDSRSEKYAVLAPFLAESIANGDQVINVVDADQRDSHLAALDKADVPVRRAMQRGQYQLLTAEETYLKAGTVDLSGMLDMLLGALESAHSDDKSVRTCGEMSWIGRSDMPTEEVMAYEARVNQFLPNYRCTLVCVYDIASLRPGMVADILATHPTAIINGRLRANPVFVEPDDFLRMLEQRKVMFGEQKGTGSPSIGNSKPD